MLCVFFIAIFTHGQILPPDVLQLNQFLPRKDAHIEIIYSTEKIITINLLKIKRKFDKFNTIDTVTTE